MARLLPPDRRPPLTPQLPRSGSHGPAPVAGPCRVDYESAGPVKVGWRFSRKEATPSRTSGPPKPSVS